MSHGDPKSVDNLIKLIERYFAAKNISTTPWPPPPPKVKAPPPATGKTVSGKVDCKHGKQMRGETIMLGLETGIPNQEGCCLLADLTGEIVNVSVSRNLDMWQ